MSTYYDLFYAKLLDLVTGRYQQYLETEEIVRLLTDTCARKLFADIPLYVATVPGLMDALTAPRAQRLQLVEECLDSSLSLVPMLELERLRKINDVDRDGIVTALSAFYFLAQSAQNESL